MLRSKFLILIFCSLIIIIGCAKNNSDSIVFSHGQSMNPSEPRFGVEITIDTIFYCEEISFNSSTYKYFFTINDGKYNYHSIQSEMLHLFGKSKVFNENADSDFTECQICIRYTDELIKNDFYLEALDVNQKDAMDKIINFKNYKFQKMKYHHFPNDILFKNLPEPPPINTK